MHVLEFFPLYFSGPFCRFSIFDFFFFFFCRFLLFSLLLHENEGLHYFRALELRHLFLRFSGHSVKEISKLLKKSERYKVNKRSKVKTLEDKPRSGGRCFFNV